MGFNTAIIIADWRAAYRDAHGFDPTDNITYVKGWFVFENMASSYVTRRRRFEVEAMTLRLLAREPRP